MPKGQEMKGQWLGGSLVDCFDRPERDGDVGGNLWKNRGGGGGGGWKLSFFVKQKMLDEMLFAQQRPRRLHRCYSNK